MSASPAISVVIPHYLGDILAYSLDALFASRIAEPFEVIVVADQPWNDGSVERAQSRYPTIRVVSTPKNVGFAAACNLGVESARGEILVVLNNDVIVTEGWLAPLVERLRAQPMVAVCAPKVLSLRRPGSFDYAGAAGGRMDCLGFPFARGRIFGAFETDLGQFDTPGEVFWVSGAAMVLKREVLREVGFFDETLFMQMEEIDFCWRLRLRGYEAHVCPQSTVLHHYSYSLPERCFRKAHLNYRNNLILLLKNLGLANLLWLLPARLLVQTLTLALALSQPREWRHAVAAISGFFHVMVRLPGILRARREVQRRRTLNDAAVLSLWYRRSIVWDYFVNGARTAAELEASRPSVPLLPVPGLS